MDATPRDFIGSYLWEGDICRIVPLEDSDSGVRAEIYRAGQGFLPTSTSDVLLKGRLISDAELKRRIVALSRSAG